MTPDSTELIKCVSEGNNLRCCIIVRVFASLLIQLAADSGLVGVSGTVSACYLIYDEVVRHHSHKQSHMVKIIVLLRPQSSKESH